MLANYGYPNRGIGFNRATWRTGNALGRAAKPYLKSAIDSVKRKLFESKVKREAQKENRRNKPSPFVSTRVGKQIPVGGGETKSFFTLKKPNATNLGKLEMVKSNVVSNLAVRASSVIGQQNSIDLGRHLDAQDVGALFTNILVTGRTAKLLIDSVHAETLITNQENINARIYLYDVVARRDAQAGFTTPSVAFKAGFADSQGGLAADFAIPGASPYNNERFTTYFKILQKTEVILSPGATHNHVLHYSPHKLVSDELRQGLASGGSIGGVTVYTFMVYHGTPENDSTTKTSVSLSACNLDIVQKESISYRYASINQSYNTITNSLPQSFAVGGETMNEDGVIQPEVAA